MVNSQNVLPFSITPKEDQMNVCMPFKKISEGCRLFFHYHPLATIQTTTIVPSRASERNSYKGRLFTSVLNYVLFAVFKLAFKGPRVTGKYLCVCFISYFTKSWQERDQSFSV